MLVDAYIVAANFMDKLNDDPLAAATADRALQAKAAMFLALGLDVHLCGRIGGE